MLGWIGPLLAADQVQIVVGEKGLQSLKYKDVEYCDPSGYGVLGFGGGGSNALPDYGNVWAPCVLDPQKNKTAFSGTPASASVKGNTVTQTYPWGSLCATYTVKDADLYITATLTNTSDKPIGWWKASLLQFNNRLVFDAKPWGEVMPYGYTPNMHYDYRWAMWQDASNGYETWNFTDPHVYWWVDKAAPLDQAPVKVMFADLDPKWQTGVYHVKTDKGDRWPVCGSSVNEDPGSNHSPLLPGRSETVRMVIRFRPAAESAIEVCRDGYEAWGRAYPRTVIWTDRRPIGTYFGCRGNSMGGTNPNGWFNEAKVDTTTPQGREAFAQRLLAEMDTVIGVLKETDAQGMLWWDVEGARWPQPVTYIGDPRVLDPRHPQHDKYAPELDTEVTYKGKPMKLVDACFKKLQEAGFRTGVTIRPNTLVWNGSPRQTGDGKDADNLCDKAAYARERWGCTLFYIDSVSEWFSNWSFEKTLAKYPDVLLMPEWARTRSYRHSSQFSYTKFTGFRRGVPAEMQACWPDAFCCMGNFDYGKDYDNALFAVQHGNVQMFNCWYACDESKKIKEIYQKAGVKHMPRAEDQKVDVPQDKPTQITLRATDEDKDPVTYGLLAPPEHGTLGGFDAKAGTVTYTPAKGYAGPDSFTFKAADNSLSSNRATVAVTVK